MAVAGRGWVVWRLAFGVWPWALADTRRMRIGSPQPTLPFADDENGAFVINE